MNMSQYIKMQMVDDNGGNHVRKNDVQNDGNEVGQNAVHNLGIQNVENMNGLSGVLEIANQYGNGNVVTAPTEGNGNGINSNPIRVNNTAKTRRPHLRSNSNTDRVPSKSKSSCLLNNIEKIEETHRKFPIPTNQKAHLGNVTISIVYYVEGLGHNLFSVGQFCDADLKVAFRKNTCFIRNLEGVDLLSGSRDINLYTISLDDMLKTSPISLLSKASKTKNWLWHRRLSHLNFGTLNKLAKDGLARGIPRL
ncbi:integrase, catalytic region, zinc finger, CCHC-type containing protein [Tanacetum coccineum]